MGLKVKKIEIKDNILDYEAGYLAGKIKAEIDYKKGINNYITNKGNIEYKKGYKDGYKYTYKMFDKKPKEDGLTKLMKNILINKYI